MSNLVLTSDLLFHCILGEGSEAGRESCEDFRGTLMLGDHSGIYSAMWKKLGII